MALSRDFRQIVAPAATGNQVYTIGFTPKVLIAFATHQTAEGFAVQARGCFGAASGSALANQRSAAWVMRTGVTTTGARCRVDDGLLFLIDTAGNTFIQVRVVSLDANGYTLNWITTTSGVLVYVLALGGADIENVGVLGWTADNPATVPATQNIAGFGFDPNFYMLYGALVTLLNTTTVNAKFCLGAAKSATERWMFTMSARDGQTMTALVDAMKHQRTDRVLAALLNNSTLAGEADHSAFITDGVQINWLDALGSAGNLFGILGIRFAAGVSFDVGAFSQATGTAPYTQDVTAPGHLPVALLLSSFCAAATTAIIVDAEEMIGVAIDPVEDEGVIWTEAVDAVLPTDTNMASLSTKAIKTANSPATTLDEGDISAMLSNGFRVNWSAASTAILEEFCYVTFGEAAAEAAEMKVHQAIYRGEERA